MAWLAESNPSELYHFHLLLDLESQASKFDNARPRNVWFLDTPKGVALGSHTPEGWTAVPFEVTFQALDETSLDELVEAQETGLMPEKYWKTDASFDE